MMKKKFLVAIIATGLFASASWSFNPDAGLTDDVVYGHEIMAVKLPKPNKPAKPVDEDNNEFTCIKCEY